jgi:hypothetical protein
MQGTSVSGLGPICVEISDSMKKNGIVQKIYLVLALAALVAMMLPESHVNFGGQVYYSYMFRSYSVWVAFGPALVLMGFVVWRLARSQVLPVWAGVAGALLIAGAALYRMIGIWHSNGQLAAGSLAQQGNLYLQPGAGIWLWAIAGILQIALIYKIVNSR